MTGGAVGSLIARVLHPSADDTVVETTSDGGHVQRRCPDRGRTAAVQNSGHVLIPGRRVGNGHHGLPLVITRQQHQDLQ